MKTTESLPKVAQAKRLKELVVNDWPLWKIDRLLLGRILSEWIKILESEEGTDQ